MSVLLFTLISPVRKTLRVSSASTSALIFLFNTEDILVWMVWEHTEAEISVQKVSGDTSGITSVRMEWRKQDCREGRKSQYSLNNDISISHRDPWSWEDPSEMSQIEAGAGAFYFRFWWSLDECYPKGGVWTWARQLPFTFRGNSLVGIKLWGANSQYSNAGINDLSQRWVYGWCTEVFSWFCWLE